MEQHEILKRLAMAEGRDPITTQAYRATRLQKQRKTKQRPGQPAHTDAKTTSAPRKPAPQQDGEK